MTTARTITISLEAASLIAKMLPQAATMNMAAMQAAAEFLNAVLTAPEKIELPNDPHDHGYIDEPEDDGLGDRATR